MVIPPIRRAFRLDKFVTGAFLLTVLCLVPRFAAAQAVLPIQWMYGADWGCRK